MSNQAATDTQEISGILGRVNQLGAATERLFNKVYNGLMRRSKIKDRERRRAELQAKIEKARQISETNKYLRKNLHKRDQEIERLHGILAVIDQGIIMQDNEGRVVFINKAARQLLGGHKNFWESEVGTLFDNYRHISHVESGSELTPMGEPTRVQVNNQILGAQLAAVANDKGERLGTMIVLSNITRDALADRLKDQFVTAISHELKTPMTVIKGMSEVLLGQEDATPPNRRLLETLSRNVDILDRMVVELLDVSEMGAGTFSIRRDKIDLEMLIDSVVKGNMPDAGKKKMEIFLVLRDTKKLTIMGDEQHLRWALGHLIQNAIGYNQRDGYILVSALIDEQNNAVIQVEDNGVGITQKDMPHIFERFYRGDPRDERGRLVDPRGLGQGLFIARTIAEAHNGYLTVESAAGQGSVFTMVIPAISK